MKKDKDRAPKFNIRIRSNEEMQMGKKNDHDAPIVFNTGAPVPVLPVATEDPKPPSSSDSDSDSDDYFKTGKRRRIAVRIRPAGEARAATTSAESLKKASAFLSTLAPLPAARNTSSSSSSDAECEDNLPAVTSTSDGTPSSALSSARSVPGGLSQSFSNEQWRPSSGAMSTCSTVSADPSEAARLLRVAMRCLEQGKLKGCIRNAQLAIAELVVAGDVDRARTRRQVQMCVDYVVSSRVLQQLNVLDKKGAQVPAARLARFFARLRLHRKHRAICLRMAAMRAMEVQWFSVAEEYFRTLLAHAPPKEQVELNNKLQECVRLRDKDCFEDSTVFLDYIAIEVVYGSECMQCLYCGATFRVGDCLANSVCSYCKHGLLDSKEF